MNRKPPAWKLAVLAWIAVFPTITGLLLVAGPWLNPLPLLGRTFILTAVLVPLMNFVLMPGLTHVFAQWLNRTNPRKRTLI